MEIREQELGLRIRARGREFISLSRAAVPGIAEIGKKKNLLL